MSTSILGRLFVALLTWAMLAPFPTPLAAQPKHEDVDEPLPEGAVMRLGSTRFRQAGQSDYVMLPDGKTVLSAGSDLTLRTWDLATGRQLRKVKLTADVTYRGSISPDGKLAVALNGDSIVVFDTITGAEKKRLDATSKGTSIHWVFFSPDTNTLGAFSQTAELTLIDWQTGKRTSISLEKDSAGVNSTLQAYFSYDGKWLVAGGGLATVCAFDLNSKEVKFRLPVASRKSIITRDGKTLIAVTMDRQLVQFDLSTGKEKSRFKLPSFYYSLDVSPDDKLLACTYGQDCCVVNLAIGAIQLKLPGSSQWGVFSRDGKVVAVTTGSKLRFWNVADAKEDFKETHELPALIHTLAASPNGRWLAVSSSENQGAVSVWDLAKGSLVRQLDFDSKQLATYLDFSADSRSLSAMNPVGSFKNWNIDTGAHSPSVEIRLPRRDPGTFLKSLRVLPRSSTAVAIVYDVRGRESSLISWDIKTEQIKGQFPIPDTFSDWAWLTGERVAIPTARGLLFADAHEISDALRTDPGVDPKTPIATSFDGGFLAVRTNPEQGKPNIAIYESASTAVAKVLQLGGVGQFALSAEGRRLFVVDSDFLRIINVATGKELGRRLLHADVSRMILLDESRLLTVHVDNLGLIWDVSPYHADKVQASNSLETLWTWLAGSDAGLALRARWELVDRPNEAISLFREHLKAAKSDVKALRDLVEKLDDASFEVRESAAKQLEKLGDSATDFLRDSLQQGVTVEQRRRIERLLAKTKGLPTGDRLRECRAVAILEFLGTPPTREFLRELSARSPSSRLATDARAALMRLQAKE